MSLTSEDLDHVIRLAHLTVSANQQSAYLEQLNKVLGYMSSLDELSLDTVEPLTSMGSQTPVREDVPIQQPDLLLEKNSPHWEQHCFQVPKIT